MALSAPHFLLLRSHFEKQSKKLQSSSPVQFCSRMSLIFGSKKAISTSIATTCKKSNSFKVLHSEENNRVNCHFSCPHCFDVPRLLIPAFQDKLKRRLEITSRRVCAPLSSTSAKNTAVTAIANSYDRSESEASQRKFNPQNNVILLSKDCLASGGSSDSFVLKTHS